MGRNSFINKNRSSHALDASASSSTSETPHAADPFSDINLPQTPESVNTQCEDLGFGKPT